MVIDTMCRHACLGLASSQLAKVIRQYFKKWAHKKRGQELIIATPDIAEKLLSQLGNSHQDCSIAKHNSSSWSTVLHWGFCLSGCTFSL